MKVIKQENRNDITRTKFTDDQMIDFAEAYHKEKVREVLIGAYLDLTGAQAYLNAEEWVDNFLKEREGMININKEKGI